MRLEITARLLKQNGKLLEDRHIVVKGRAKTQTTITVSRNETVNSLNQKDKFSLTIELVNETGGYDGPYFLRYPFQQEPDFGVASVNYELQE